MRSNDADCITPGCRKDAIIQFEGRWYCHDDYVREELRRDSDALLHRKTGQVSL